MKSVFLKMLLVAFVFPWAFSSMAAPVSDHEGPVVWQGRKYCWYGAGWNGAGWYRCGFDKKKGRGWGGPKGWPRAAGASPSSGALFDLPPPTSPVARRASQPSATWSRSAVAQLLDRRPAAR